MSIAPKSGFRLQIMLVQFPLGWDDINNELYEPDKKEGRNWIFVGDGDGFDSGGTSKQGGFNLEGSWFTKIHNTPNRAETTIHPAYSKMFEWQQKTFEHMKYLQKINKLKVSHHQCRVIYDKQTVVINRTRTIKRKTLQHMYKMSTTWKYPPCVHDNETYRYDNTPDRRVYFIIITTPLFGGVDDTGQDMYDIEQMAEDLPPEDERVQFQAM